MMEKDGFARRAVPIVFSAILLTPGVAAAADVILTEFNAVAGNKWLGNPSDPLCEGPGGVVCSTEEDLFFGRVIGNGGNWFELVVITDHLDMRGWRFDWQEVLLGKAGIIFLSSHVFWSDLRAGTILTFTESTTAQGGLDTDLSFDPCVGDWWINVNTFDTTYVSFTTTNVAGDGPGNFSVGNDDWIVTIQNAGGAPLYGPAGEGAVCYLGGNVNSREIWRLEAHPDVSVTECTQSDDGTRSTFGAFNNWTELGCRIFADFSLLRGPIESACDLCGRVALNEYNGVGDAVFLNGGDALADADGGQAADTFFGRVLGNGGNWFELVILGDHLDVRGWTLAWEEFGTGYTGTISLSQHALWSDLRSGTILTFIERTTAQGGLDTDTSYDPSSGDRWINVNTFDAAYVIATTSTIPGHISGQFEVNDFDWRVSVLDDTAALLYGPAGEGSIYYYQEKVSVHNVLRLEEDPTTSLTPLAAYDDGSSVSTFGAPNQWLVCPDPTPVIQDFSALPDLVCDPNLNSSDLNGDGFVNITDLLQLLSAWGPCPGCPEDLDGDGQVNITDLLMLLGDWT